MNKPSFKDRFRYWFDNRMSKGSIELIRILLIFTILFSQPADIIWFKMVIDKGLRNYISKGYCSILKNKGQFLLLFKKNQ